MRAPSFGLLICVISCCVLSMSWVKAAPIGFDVGTAPGKADVIFNGTALPGWDGVYTNNTRIQLLPYQLSLTLYVTLNVNVNATNITQGFNATGSVSGGIFPPTIPPNTLYISPNQSHGVLQGGVVHTIDLNFLCAAWIDARFGIINITFSFENPSADNVILQFEKICQWPPMYIAGPPSTPSNLTSLAIANGSYVRSYTYVSPPNVDTDVFYLWLPANLSYFPYANYSVRASGLPWITIPTWMSMSWEQSSNTVYPLSVGYTTVTVRYVCNNTVPASSGSVGLVFNTGYDDIQILSWTKNCSYGTGITTPNVFYVSAYEQAVVQGGSPTSAWFNDTGYHLPANTRTLQFSVYINETTRFGESTLPFTVTGNATDANPVFSINHGAITNFVAHMYSQVKVGNTANTTNTTTTTTVPVEITCLRAGLGNGSITFGFGQQYYPITVLFSYTCTQPYFDVDHVSAEGYIIERIISSNIALSWNYTSPPTSIQEFFRIGLTNQTKDTVQDVNIANIAYNSSVISTPLVFVDDMPLNSSIWFPLQVGFPNITHVVLKCYGNQSATTWVNITLNYGWQQTQQIAFQKTCVSASADSSSSSSLAAGYIVLIAAGSFLALCCCTCAGYKYTKQEKRGCDVLPGISLLRGCYQCLCPTKEYLTQTDGDDHHAGKSYQSTENK